MLSFPKQSIKLEVRFVIKKNVHKNILIKNDIFISIYMAENYIKKVAFPKSQKLIKIMSRAALR